jgi:hypothetical protein
MSGPTLADLRAAKRRLARRFLSPAVSPPMTAFVSLEAAVDAAGAQIHAVGIGRKHVEGKKTSTRCVRFHVLQKLPRAMLARRHRIPSSIDGIPTDVVVTPRAVLLAAQACPAGAVEQRPLRGAIGISGPRTTAGTLACFIRLRNGAPGTFLLTCSHVLADGQATVGDPVVQPALADGGSVAKNSVASLEMFTGVLSAAAVDVDAAVAKLLDGVAFDPEICGLGRPQGTKAPQQGLGVERKGKSTAAGSPSILGSISEPDCDISIAVPGGGTVLYQDQFRIEPLSPTGPFSVGGDSGSLILQSGSTRAVGMLVGGDPGGSFSVATPIQRVLDRFEVDLL